MQKAKYLMANKNIKPNLVFTKANYSNIQSCTTCLEASGISLVVYIVNKPYILNDTSNQGNCVNKIKKPFYTKCWLYNNGTMKTTSQTQKARNLFELIFQKN